MSWNLTGKHKLVGAIGVPWNGGGSYKSPFRLEILSTRSGAPGFPIATGSLVANTGQSVTVSRSASAFCRTRSGLVYLGANTARVEANPSGQLGLLVEGARTNIAPYSSLFTSWSFSAAAATAAAGTAPDGTLTAQSFTPSSAGTILPFIYEGPASAFVAATTYTASIYAKAGTVHFLNVSIGNTSNARATFDLSNGTSPFSSGATNVATEALANGWYRCVFNFTGNASDTYIILSLGDTAAHCNNANFGAPWTAAGTESVLVWGMQIEVGAFASSLIPNATSGSVSRDADRVSVSNPLFSLSQPIGAWKMSATATPLGKWGDISGLERVPVSMGPNGGPDAATIYPYNGTTVYQVTYDNSSTQAYSNGTQANDSATHAYMLRSSSTGPSTGYIDGSSATFGGGIGAGTGILNPMPTTVYLGNYNDGSRPLWGWLTNIIVDGT